jgi:hypothetical protein
MDDDQTNPPAPWNGQTISPFSSKMAGLIALELQSHPGIYLDDDALTSLTSGLPQLESLRLTTDRTGLQYIPSATLGGLFWILFRYPALRELAIDLNALVSYPHLPYRPSQLQALELGWPPISNACAVAEIFNKAFPRLQYIRWEQEKMKISDLDLDSEVDDGPIFGCCWEQVNMWLGTLKISIRREEQLKYKARISVLESQLRDLQSVQVSR